MRWGILTKLQRLPIVTVSLLAVIWTIEAIAQFGGHRLTLIENYGLHFDNYLTYFTHAFIHAHLPHIVENSVGLLIFGSIVELQLRAKWIFVAALCGVLAGAIGATLFYEITDASTTAVGLSAATSALSVLCVGVLARYWVATHIRIWEDPVLLDWVVVWMTVRFFVDYFGSGGWDYSVVSHLAGELTGGAIVVLTLRNPVPTAETIRCLERIRIILTAARGERRDLSSSSSSKNKAGQVFAAIFVATSLAVLVAGVLQSSAE